MSSAKTVFSPIFQKVTESSLYFLELFETQGVPDVAVVLGSGLGNALPELQTFHKIPFNNIPGFEATEVLGHASEVCYGKLKANINGQEQEKTMLFLRGRNHAYEGFSVAQVVHNLRSLIKSGIKNILLTNAAGCLNTNWQLGDLMLIQDHINFTGLNPLAGDSGKGFAPQFVDMSSCYNQNLQVHFKEIALKQKLSLREGVYFGVLGPSYETPAEIRMMKTLGASAVGMSTVLEAIASKQLGANIAGLSCLTNYGAGLSGSGLNHLEVIDVGKQAGEKMATLVREALLTWPSF